MRPRASTDHRTKTPWHVNKSTAEGGLEASHRGTLTSVGCTILSRSLIIITSRGAYVCIIM